MSLRISQGRSAGPVQSSNTSRSSGSWTATQILWLFALLAAIALFHILSIKPGHEWGDDFAMYIAHARNLVEGRDYSDTGYIYNPAEPIGPPRAPPGLPLLLAPIYAVRGLDLVAMKMLMVAAFVTALAFLAFLVREWEGFGAALAVTALLGFHPYFWDVKNTVMSDLPFLCFFLIGIWMGQRTLTSSDRSASVRDGIQSGFVWWAAYAVRTVGIVLPLSLVATEVFLRRKVQRSTLVAVVTFGLLATAQALLLQSPHDYLVQYSFHPELILPNIHAYTAFLRGLLDSGFSILGAGVAFGIAIILAAVGFVSSWLKGNRFPAVILFVYLGGSLLWPYTEGGRYLIPVIPFFFFYVVAGLLRLSSEFPRSRSVATLVTASLIVAIYVGRYRTGPIHRTLPGIDSPPARSLFAFFRNSTPKNSIIVFKKPRALALYTGRRAAIYTTADDVDPWQFIDKVGATYFVSIRRSAQDSAFLSRLAMERPQSTTRVFSNEEFTVYRVAARSGLYDLPQLIKTRVL